MNLSRLLAIISLVTMLLALFVVGVRHGPGARDPRGRVAERDAGDLGSGVGRRIEANQAGYTANDLRGRLCGRDRKVAGLCQAEAAFCTAIQVR
jgi:hypothetical protein